MLLTNIYNFDETETLLYGFARLLYVVKKHIDLTQNENKYIYMTKITVRITSYFKCLNDLNTTHYAFAENK